MKWSSSLVIRRFKNLFLVLFIVSMSTSSFGLSDFAVADKDEHGKTTSVESLGILQLAAHDFFNVNRCRDHEGMIIPGCTVIDNENGKLDLSTLLVNKTSECNFDDCEPLSDEDIALGGEFRNRESILIFTVSSELGETYLDLREKFGEEQAYDKTLEIYHKKIKLAFLETFNQPFPKPQSGDVSPIHNLALRSGHDFLPGFVKYNGEYVNVFTLTGHGDKFSQSERKQMASPLDGEFDDVFTGIDVCVVPTFCIKVDLLEADRSFGDQFGMGADRFDQFMEQTSDGRYDKEEEVTQLIIELFARGINLS